MSEQSTSTAVEAVRPPEPTAIELADRAMQKRAVQLSKAKGLLPQPLRDKPAEVYLILVKAQGLGIPDGEALANLYPIQGRIVPSAQLQAALVRRAGHKLIVTEQNRERCIVRARRREDHPDDTLTVTYTTDDARSAGLLDHWVEHKVKLPGDQWETTEKFVVAIDDEPIDIPKKDWPDWARTIYDAGNIKRRDNWFAYRMDMLRARAISQACRSLFSDCLLGIGGAHDWTDEEVERAESRVQAHSRNEDEPDFLDIDNDALEELEPIACQYGVDGCEIEGEHKHDPHIARQAAAKSQPTSPADEPDYAPGEEPFV